MKILYDYFLIFISFKNIEINILYIYQNKLCNKIKIYNIILYRYLDKLA